MAEYVIIGLSTFGRVLAHKLYEMHENVLVIDQDKDKIQEFKDEVTQAITADASDKKVLEQLLPEGDTTAIVSVGENLGRSVIATYNLKELGVKEIIAKAGSADEGKVLKLVGATHVIYPEQDMALRLAEKLTNPNVMESIRLGKGFSIVELTVPANFIGKTLQELDLRRSLGINVLATKRSHEKEFAIPEADYIFHNRDIIVVMGRNESVNEMSQ